MELQVIYLKDVLPISAADNVPGMVPRTLDVRGPDFDSVDHVLINDIESPSVVVASPTQIYAQVPDVLAEEQVHSIAVVGGEFTRTDASRVMFGLTRRPRLVAGMERLVQSFLMLLFTSTGSDAWYPGKGGNLQKIIGGNFSRRDSGSVVAEFSVAIGRTRTQMVAAQATNPRLQDTERLAAAEVLQSVFDPSSAALIARVQLTNRTGERARVNLET